MKFEIHFEFRASLRKFQDLNFWGAIGAQDDQVMEEEVPQAPPTQVRATIQWNHPVDQILGDISKGVTTRSRLANFCEHYSFVSSIEPFRVEEALLDPEWVLAM
jgi:hypothetical protein